MYSQSTQVIKPLPGQKWLAYRVNILQRSTLGALAYENVIKFKVKKERIAVNDTGRVYSVDIRHIKQSNTEGTRGVEFAVKQLMTYLTVQTDPTGRAVDIRNLSEIREKWRKVRPDLRARYGRDANLTKVLDGFDAVMANDELLTATILEADVITILFPAVYGTLAEPGDTSEGEKTFSNFFGDTSLPLKLTNTLKTRTDDDEQINILRKGQLDEARFDAMSVRRFFKKLADNYKLDVQTEIKYVETFDLSPLHWVTYGGQVLSANVPGLFRYDQVMRLTLIT